jgi:hypothetical protein
MDEIFLERLFFVVDFVENDDLYYYMSEVVKYYLYYFFKILC